MPIPLANSRPSAPYWSRNPGLFEADINNKMYPYMQQGYGQTFQGPGARPVAPGRAAGGGNMANAQRVAAVMQGRQTTPQRPLPMDAGPSKVRSLASDYQRQINKANQANEQRYNDILQRYRDREASAVDQANLVRDQRYRDESARIQNDLISRGLANSSLQGKEHFKAYERNAQFPLAVQMQTSGDTLGFMERRNDIGPDPAMLLQLAAQQGQTEQFANQNIGQAVNEIGQAVDNRVATGANAPQPNRMVNVPVMGQPVFNNGYTIPQMMPQMQQGYNPWMMQQQAPQGQPGQQQNRQLSPGMLEVIWRQKESARMRREAAIRNGKEIQARQLRELMAQYPWLFGNRGSGGLELNPPPVVNPPMAGSAPYPFVSAPPPTVYNRLPGEQAPRPYPQQQHVNESGFFNELFPMYGPAPPWQYPQPYVPNGQPPQNVLF